MGVPCRGTIDEPRKSTTDSTFASLTAGVSGDVAGFDSDPCPPPGGGGAALGEPQPKRMSEAAKNDVERSDRKVLAGACTGIRQR